MPTLPVTAIVIFRNERELLTGCLRAVRSLCDQVIGVDMQSSDGSRDVALDYVDMLLEAPVYPIAEPTRVAAAQFAKHDWVLLIDPDEHIPPELAEEIRHAMHAFPGVAAIRLPWWYYFKRKRLDGTIWGGGRATKRMLVHRKRCNLLPYCNRIVELRPGFTEHTIAHRDASGGNHIRHYWCDSYHKLLMRHLTRYCHTEAKAQVAGGQRFSLSYGCVHPVRELYRCLRHYDGWRIGPRGWALSLIYFTYVVASSWLTLRYQGSVKPEDPATHATLPTLNQVRLNATLRRAA